MIFVNVMHLYNQLIKHIILLFILRITDFLTFTARVYRTRNIYIRGVREWLFDSHSRIAIPTPILLPNACHFIYNSNRICGIKLASPPMKMPASHNV